MLAKLRMVDAFGVFVPYSQTLSSNMVLDAYYQGHESGSRHAWALVGQMREGLAEAWSAVGALGR